MFEVSTEAISDQEWEEAIAAHLAWGETWRGDLPADVFFGLWAGLAGEAKPLIVTVQLDTPKPTVTVPPESPLTVEDNLILLEDGRELMIQFTG
jgi:hypothetical protein